MATCLVRQCGVWKVWKEKNVIFIPNLKGTFIISIVNPDFVADVGYNGCL